MTTTRNRPPTRRRPTTAPPRGKSPNRQNRPAIVVAESRWQQIVRWLMYAAPSVFVFTQLRPRLLLADTTPAGGDLGAHVIGPSLLRAHLFDQGFLSGWSNAWYGGFPAFRFYMPIPALGAVLLDVIVPSGVALKLAVALPLIALPAVAVLFARSAGPSFPHGPLLAAGTLLFLFDDSYDKLGGNIASTIVGEYAYAWALVAGLACLAVFNRDLAHSRKGPAAGVLGAIAAASHPVGMLFALVAVVARASLSPAAHRRFTLFHSLRTLALVGSLSAFWYLPLFWYRSYYNDLNHQRVTGFGSLLFSLPVVLELCVVGLAVFGAIMAMRSRNWAVVTLGITALVFAFGVLVAPNGALWNARLAPPWHLCRMMLAGFGAAELVAFASKKAARDHAPRIRYFAPVAVVVVVMVALTWDLGALPGGSEKAQTLPGGLKVVSEYEWLAGPAHTPNKVAQYTTFGFGGYERGPSWPQYQAFVGGMRDVAREHGCGRVHYEFDPTGAFGSTYAIALLPYWTDGCVTTVMGFYTESSPNSAVALVAESAASPVFSNYEPGLPYERLNLSRAVSYMREVNAKYYVAKTPSLRAQARVTTGLRSLTVAGDWEIFLVDDALLVEGLAALPVVEGGSDRAGWEERALAWFTQANPDAARFSASGPANWPRQGSGAATIPTPVATVSDIVDRGDVISFRVDQIGSPVLVRVSYFPTWTASGADGPWRVSPNWMVVVPTGNEVTLRTRAGTVEWMATLVTIAGLVAALAWAARLWWLSRVREGTRAQ